MGNNKQYLHYAVRSKAWVCIRLIAVIAGSNPAGVMDVRLLCCAGSVPQRRGTLSLRTALSDVCPIVCDLEKLNDVEAWARLGLLRPKIYEGESNENLKYLYIITYTLLRFSFESPSYICVNFMQLVQRTRRNHSH